MEIYPSLISADILNLRNVIEVFNDHCDGYHIDIMDDHFVPNLTWGPAFVNAIAKITTLPLHVHLMVDNPEKWIGRIKVKSGDIFIFHYEAIKDFQKIKVLIELIKNQKCLVGIAINPDTSIEKVFDYLFLVDHILLMSVDPGFSGQKFIPEVIEKVQPLISFKENHDLNFKIGMDGGIGLDNIGMLAKRGVKQFGVASAIFSAKDSVGMLNNLYNS